MRIFVTGGAGFIGSHLCQALLYRDHEVVAYDNLSLGRRELLTEPMKSKRFRLIEADLLDLDRVREEIRGHDLVFHLAANSDILAGTKRTDLDLRIGTLATYNVLEAMRLEQVPHIVFASTSAIYGEAQTKPTPEHYGPLLPISFYGASKLACEALITAFSHNYGIRGWIYRFANIVGAHSTHGAIHDFIHRLRNNPNELRVLGNGRQKKSYLHVSDCVDGMLEGYTRTLASPTNMTGSETSVHLFNLASQGVTDVRHIAEQVVLQMNVPAQIIYGEEDRGWKGDVPFTWLDGAALHKLGWNPQYPSDQAVALAIQNILEEMGT